MPRPSDAGFTNSRRKVRPNQSWLSRSRQCPYGSICQPRRRRGSARSKSRRDAFSTEASTEVGRRKWEMKSSESQAPKSKVQKDREQRHFFGIWGLRFVWILELGIWNFCAPTSALADGALTLCWTNNLLTISNVDLPGGKLDVWYLEAFCRKGSTHQDWGKTTLPHKTVLTSASPRRLDFRTSVEPSVEVLHSV